MNWQILVYWALMPEQDFSDALFRFLFALFAAVSIASCSLSRWCLAACCVYLAAYDRNGFWV